MNMIVRTPWNMLDQWHNEMGQLLSTPSGRDDTSLVEGSDCGLLLSTSRRRMNVF